MSDVASVEKRITQAMINAYADASGDHNPIHVDETFAKATPFGGTIAHGMLTLAAISEMMAGAFGKRWLAAGKLKVRFRAPARPGDTITASATPQTNERYAVQVANQQGEVLISGTAELSDDAER
jgi:3-hydroxybutyryl-CoA dehydratase